MSKASKQAAASEETLEQPIVEEQTQTQTPVFEYTDRSNWDFNWKRPSTNEDAPAAILDGE
jgi:hypothetical protein